MVQSMDVDESVRRLKRHAIWFTAVTQHAMVGLVWNQDIFDDDLLF